MMPYRKLLWTLTALIFADCLRSLHASAQSELSQQESAEVRELVESVAENMYRPQRYQLIGTWRHNKFDLEDNPDQLSTTAEMVFCVDFAEKYKRFIYHRDYVWEGKLSDEVGWRSEFTRAGVRKTDRHLGGGEQEFNGSSMPIMDPMELPMCCFERISGNHCVTGAFFQLCDPDKAIRLEHIKDALVVTFQITTKARARVVFSQKQGMMPIQSTIFINWHGVIKNASKDFDSDDYQYVAYENTCTWKKFEETWYPVEIQVDSISQRIVNKRFPPPTMNMEYEFQWYIGDEITQKEIDTLEPLKLKALIEQKVNVKN